MTLPNDSGSVHAAGGVTLVEMGFEAEAARRALARSNGDVAGRCSLTPG